MTTQHEDPSRFFTTMDMLDGQGFADLSGWPELGPLQVVPGELDLPSLDFSMSTSVTTPEDPAWFPFQPVMMSMANIPESERCARCEEQLLRRLDEVSAQQASMEESQRRNGILLIELAEAVSDLAKKLDSFTGTDAESSEKLRLSVGLFTRGVGDSLYRQDAEAGPGPVTIDQSGSV